METDDVDNLLVRQLSCLGTNDREALIKEFQTILGGEEVLNVNMCAFFLDMSSWNLQAALGAYYDYGAANNVTEMSYVDDVLDLDMQLVQDVTIGEGESIAPNTKFIKTWKVRNSGSSPWRGDTTLNYMEGTRLSEFCIISVPHLQPGEETELSVEMQSPAGAGMYQTRWQLNTAQQIPFGESIWCIINVDANGILDITQAMAGAPLGQSPQQFQYPSTSSNVFQFRQAITYPCQAEYGTEMVDMSMVASTSTATYPPRTAPIMISREQSMDGPTCTPCTPPDEHMQQESNRD